jgi:hypothetical protein
MVPKKLVPYSVYISVEQYKKLKVAAKNRQASSLIRNAIDMIIDGNDAFTSGYNQACKDASKIIYDCEEAQMIAVKGKDLGALLSEKIQTLKKD